MKPNPAGQRRRLSAERPSAATAGASRHSANGRASRGREGAELRAASSANGRARRCSLNAEDAALTVGLRAGLLPSHSGRVVAAAGAGLRQVGRGLRWGERGERVGSLPGNSVPVPSPWGRF